MVAEKTELPRQLVRRVYIDLHQANQNSIELTEIVQSETSSIKKLLDSTIPWSYWYDFPYAIVLTILLKVTGLYDRIISISKENNPEALLLDFLESEPEIEDEDNLSREEQAFIATIVIAVIFQIPSISMFNTTINQLLEQARQGDDKALFKAIMVDRSVLTTPSVARRIQLAQLKKDHAFFKKLSKALVRKQIRRPAKKLDDVRFMISALQDNTTLSKLSNPDFYSLLVDDLELYSTDGKDPFKSFEQLLTRSRKNINDTK
tara:strand:- start:9109 stop:9894 length:786 start_codon:yes stop_codon:yes gene_type:complete